MINAINTYYNGYRFRSRTEARWAVFFYWMDIEYEYEKEGYKLPSGAYLPDFYLPKFNGGCFAEVKGQAFNDMEIKKCEELYSGTSRRVLMLDGIPDFKWYHYIGKGSKPFCPRCPDFGNNFPENCHINTKWIMGGKKNSDSDCEAQWLECPSRSGFIFGRGSRGGKHGLWEDWGDGFNPTEEEMIEYGFGDTVDAIKAARGTRFEFQRQNI